MEQRRLEPVQFAGLGQELVDRSEQFEEATERFRAARQELLAEGGGVAHIYYHPCEFVHEKFWDGIFLDGENPPPEDWKAPSAKTAEQSRIAYENFEFYIRWIKNTFDDVEFLTATDAARLYRDRARGRTFSASEIREIAGEIAKRAAKSAEVAGFSLLKLPIQK